MTEKEQLYYLINGVLDGSYQVRFKVQGQDHGLNIEVIIEPGGEGIITGYVK